MKWLNLLFTMPLRSNCSMRAPSPADVSLRNSSTNRSGFSVLYTVFALPRYNSACFCIFITPGVMICIQNWPYYATHTFAWHENKKGWINQPSLLFAECGLEGSDQRIVLRLGQRVSFRIDKLQAAAVIEVANLDFVVTGRQLWIACPQLLPGAIRQRLIGRCDAAR